MVPGEQLCTERPAYGEKTSEPALAAGQKQRAGRQGLGFVVWEFRIGGGKWNTRFWMQNTSPHPAQPQIGTKLCPCGLTGVAGTNWCRKSKQALKVFRTWGNECPQTSYVSGYFSVPRAAILSHFHSKLPFWLQLQWERMRRLFNVLYHWEQEELVLCSLPASPESGVDHYRLISQAGGAAGPWLMQIALNI